MVADYNVSGVIGAPETEAINTAVEASNTISHVMSDIRDGHLDAIDSDGTLHIGQTDPKDNWSEEYNNYGISGIGMGTATNKGSVDISTAAGAMIIDDLMTKISTRVQVASQLIAAGNNLAKTATRILSQG